MTTHLSKANFQIVLMLSTWRTGGYILNSKDAVKPSKKSTNLDRHDVISRILLASRRHLEYHDPKI